MGVYDCKLGRSMDGCRAAWLPLSRTFARPRMTESRRIVSNAVARTVLASDRMQASVRRLACWRASAALGALLLSLIAEQASAAPFAYMTSTGDNSVLIIDTATNTVVGAVPVGSTPYGAVVTPDGARVYVANDQSNTVSVIGTWVNTVIATIPVGVNPFGIAMHPSGCCVYVGNRGSNFVSVIETQTDEVIATVAVGGEPRGLAINRDGTRLYVVNRSTNNISVVDTAAAKVIATVGVGQTPYGAAVDPRGSRLYVANTFDDSVSVIDAATNQVIATVPVGSHPRGVAVHPDGTVVYVSNLFDGTVSVIDTATNRVVATLQVGAGAYGIDFTPDGKHAYVANSQVKNPDGSYGGSISVIDAVTTEVLGTIVAGNKPHAFGVGFIGPESPVVPTATLSPTPTATPIATNPDATATPAPPDATATAQAGTPKPTPTATAFGCASEPFAGCRRPTIDRRASLVIRNRTPDTKNVFAWRWLAGEATPIEAFGDPLSEDDYALCLYDESGGVATLLVGARAAAGGTCNRKPCWKQSRHGFRYVNGAPAAGELRSLLLGSGKDGTARVVATVVGSHANPALPLALPIRVQLQNDAGECWESSFVVSGVKADDALHFDARARIP